MEQHTDAVQGWSLFFQREASIQIRLDILECCYVTHSTNSVTYQAISEDLNDENKKTAIC